MHAIAFDWLYPVIIGPYDGETVAELDETDLELTLTQFGDQSLEVTDRDHTITMATTGGESIVIE